MDAFVLRVFQREVERQCCFALVALDDLHEALRGVVDVDRLWYSVQALLVAAGNVSKLLWPPDSQFEERGRQLRGSLGVPDESPLQPRTFRNHFEHFDERLERWASSSQRRNVVDSCVGPPGMIAGLEPADYLRNLDTESFAVTFRGDSYPLQPIADSLRKLWQKAEVEASKRR